MKKTERQAEEQNSRDPRILWFFAENRGQLHNQWRNIFLQCVPEHIHIQHFISVHDSVPHADRAPPGNFGMPIAGLLGHPGRGFADDFHKMEQGKLQDAGIAQSFNTLTRRMGLRFQGMLQHMAQVDGVVMPRHRWFVLLEAPRRGSGG